MTCSISVTLVMLVIGSVTVVRPAEAASRPFEDALKDDRLARQAAELPAGLMTTAQGLDPSGLAQVRVQRRIPIQLESSQSAV